MPARPPSLRHCVGLPKLVCMLLQRKGKENEEVKGVGWGPFVTCVCM